MIKNRTIFFIYICLIFFAACGKKAPLKAPNIVLPKPPVELSTDIDGDVVTVAFKLLKKNIDGSDFDDYKGIEVYRAAVMYISTFCKDCDDGYELIHKGDVVKTGEGHYIYSDKSLTKEELETCRFYYYKVRVFNRDNTPRTYNKGLSGFSAPVAANFFKNDLDK